MPETFNIEPALIFGSLIGIYEAIIIHRDVKVISHRIIHTLHSFVLSIIFVFFTSNSELILKLFPLLTKIPFIGTVLGFQITIGVIAVIKIHAASKTIQQTSLDRSNETWFHSILVGALIVAVPYIYPFIKHLIPRFI